MFIDPKVSRAANEWVRNQAEDKLPTFRRTSPGLVEVNGGILRYSSTSEA
jgi:hypothetical protein